MMGSGKGRALLPQDRSYRAGGSPAARHQGQGAHWPGRMPVRNWVRPGHRPVHPAPEGLDATPRAPGHGHR